MSVRTSLERDADRADCALYRAISQLETMYERHEDARPAIAKALNALRTGRGSLRSLMHKSDRERTQ